MAVSRPTYATREQLARATDVRASAHMDAQLDDALEAGAEAVDALCHRTFYPTLATRYFPWPPPQTSKSWVLWLDANELASLTTLVAGGTTIASTDYFLEPDTGPPYNRVEIDLSSSAALASGDTHQRAIAITGLWAGCPITHGDVGTLAAAVSSTTATTISVSNSGTVGVGDIIHPDYGGSSVYEHMLVTGKTMADTGVNIDAGDSLTASKADVSITVSTTTAMPQVGETILIGSERMLVVDVAGSVLTVIRAYDGTLLAAHAGGADIYAPRTLTVTRGAVGTTAATHTDGATLARHVAPGLVRQLNLAEAIAYGQQNGAGWASTAGSGDTARAVVPEGLPRLRAQVYAKHGRKARTRAV